MKCPYCAYAQDRVVDSRESKDADAIRDLIGNAAANDAPQRGQRRYSTIRIQDAATPRG